MVGLMFIDIEKGEFIFMKTEHKVVLIKYIIPIFVGFICMCIMSATKTNHPPGDYYEINEENFPDETFRRYLANRVYGKDGKISEADILGVKEIDLYNMGINDLYGIEIFSELEKLVCAYNNISKLNLSYFTKLKELDCFNNKLNSLDLTKNIELINLDCDNNPLSVLDVSNNIKLEELICYDCELNNLNLSKNTELKFLYCSNNPLGTLNISNNNKLETLYCDQCNLSSIDLSRNVELVRLSVADNNLKNLSFSTNKKLIALYCENNKIDALNLSYCTELNELNCLGNEKVDLVLPTNTHLKTYDNRVEIGMTYEEVEKLWGEPYQTSIKSFSDGDLIYAWYYDTRGTNRWLIYDAYGVLIYDMLQDGLGNNY